MTIHPATTRKTLSPGAKRIELRSGDGRPDVYYLDSARWYNEVPNGYAPVDGPEDAELLELLNRYAR